VVNSHRPPRRLCERFARPAVETSRPQSPSPNIAAALAKVTAVLPLLYRARGRFSSPKLFCQPAHPIRVRGILVLGAEALSQNPKVFGDGKLPRRQKLGVILIRFDFVNTITAWVVGAAVWLAPPSSPVSESK
jgi:hypothetical protein